MAKGQGRPIKSIKVYTSATILCYLTFEKMETVCRWEKKNIFGLKDLFHFAGLEERVRKTLEKINRNGTKQTNNRITTEKTRHVKAFKI